MDYQNSMFNSPDATPISVRSTVATIKILEASGRQMEIINQVRKLPKAGDAFIASEKDQPLIEEFEQLKRTIELWSRVKKKAA
jgi:hypothetical protein